MAKQLAFENGLRHGGAVYRDERPSCTLAAVVERPRGHLLTGAGLALDQDIDVDV